MRFRLLVLESNWIHEVHHRPQRYFVRSPTDKQTYDVEKKGGGGGGRLLRLRSRYLFFISIIFYELTAGCLFTNQAVNSVYNLTTITH